MAVENLEIEKPTAVDKLLPELFFVFYFHDNKSQFLAFFLKRTLLIC